MRIQVDHKHRKILSEGCMETAFIHNVIETYHGPAVLLQEYEGCSSLTDIAIPGSVTSIDDSAF